MLKLKYESKEEIPSEHLSLYVERDGAWMLDVDGLKTDEDVSRLKKALDSERDAHKKSKADAKRFESLESKLDKILSAGKDEDEDEDEDPPDDKKGGKNLDPTLNRLRKQMESQAKVLEDMQKRNSELELENKQKSIVDQIRKLATGKIRQEAIVDLEAIASQLQFTDDKELVSNDGTPANEWLDGILKTRPHWKPINVGGGATGGKGDPAGKLTLEQKQAKFDKINNSKEDLKPTELVDALALAQEIKAEQQKGAQ